MNTTLDAAKLNSDSIAAATVDGTTISIPVTQTVDVSELAQLIINAQTALASATNNQTEDSEENATTVANAQAVLDNLNALQAQIMPMIATPSNEVEPEHESANIQG